MSSVILKNVSKKFGKVMAVNDVSFEVKDGEFVVLLGPSGSGKTTTLRLIAGLEFPDSGEIWIGDRLVNKLPPKDRDVALVFQNYALYPHKTVYENLAFPLKVRHFSKDEIDIRVREVAEILRIEELLDRKPGQLSGGQQQRVALGRALIRQPKVWLLDEPLSNLDAKLRVYMRTELKRLQRELKITSIYVTHDQAEAITLADKVIVFNRGVIQQIGKPQELYNKPANLFVATFIGSPPMNTLKGIIYVKENNVFLDLGFGKIKLPNEYAGLLKAYHEKEVILGIRPEDIEILFEPRENSLKVIVDIVEPLGNMSILNLTSNKELNIKALYPGDFPQGMIGKELYMSFKPDRIHLFDPKNEGAII